LVIEGVITQAKPNSFDCIANGPFDGPFGDPFADDVVSPELAVELEMASPTQQWPDLSHLTRHEVEALITAMELGDRKRSAVKAQLVSRLHAGSHTLTSPADSPA
jgi:hypothetical protein